MIVTEDEGIADVAVTLYLVVPLVRHSRSLYMVEGGSLSATICQVEPPSIERSRRVSTVGGCLLPAGTAGEAIDMSMSPSSSSQEAVTIGSGGVGYSTLYRL